MRTTGLTIRRAHRDALNDGLLVSSTAIGDIGTSLLNGEVDDAQRSRERFDRELRLLDDLGWARESEDDWFLLTMPASALRAVLERFYWHSAAVLANPEAVAAGGVELPRRLMSACAEVLVQIVERTGGVQTL